MHLDCLAPAARTVIKKIAPIVTEGGFILAGGTGTALHLGHRLSVDFDFFTTRSFRTDKVLGAISDLGLKIEVLQEEAGTLTLSVDGVKVSFFHYPQRFLGKTSMLDRIAVAGLIDIASMKLVDIMQRGAKRDFVDLYWILQDVPFAKIAENLIARFGRNRLNPVVIGKALVYFQDADTDPEPEYLGNSAAWTKIKMYFKNHVQQFVLDIQKAIES